MIRYSKETPVAEQIKKLVIFIEKGLERWGNENLLHGYTRRLEGKISKQVPVEVKKQVPQLPSTNMLSSYDYEIVIGYPNGPKRKFRVSGGQLYSSVFDTHSNSYKTEQALDFGEAQQIISDLLSTVIWGNNADINRYGELPIVDISDSYIEILGLEHLSTAEKNILASSRWLSVEGGKVIVQILRDIPPRPRRMHLIDYDDTIMNATEWHQAEFRSISNFFQNLGITFSVEQAREIYNSSKILVPGKAEKEPRYTPALNLLLLNHLLKKTRDELFSIAQAIESAREEKDQILSTLNEHGDRQLLALVDAVDPKLIEIFINNPPSNFVYTDMVEDLFFENENQHEIVNAIITRGTTEGLLGQVHKVNSSGIMEGLHFVVYTNDLKSELIELIGSIFPSTGGIETIIYDDNPVEIAAFYDEVKAKKRRGVQLVQVRHPGSKRASFSSPVPPDVRVPEIIPSDPPPNHSTVYDHFIIDFDQVTN